MPEALVPLVGRRVNERIIRENWSDVLRAAASMAARRIVPSQYLRRLASFPKRNALAQAWREIGRIERTIFVLDWLLDEALQRRVQIGLNKGEAHHALKDAIHFHRKGELRDRSREDQELRIAAMNFLAAVIIFYNTRRLDAIVTAMAAEGTAPPPELLAHVSPLGWEHIVLTGEYTWRTEGRA
jgi:TnpA family transposase